MGLPPGMMWPGWEWWCHLKAADQGAWASGIGAFVAAGVALLIALGEGRRRRKEAKARATMAMASLYSPAVGILTMIKGIEADVTQVLSLAADMNADMRTVSGLMSRIQHGSEVIRPQLQMFRTEEAVHLPGVLGPLLATAFRDAELLDFVVRSATDGYFPAFKSQKIASMRQFVISLTKTPEHARNVERRLHYFVDVCARTLKKIDPNAVD